MTNRPPLDLFRRLLFVWRRFWCPHSRVFVFFPGPAWSRCNGEPQERIEHGARVTCCQDCGETWGENCDE